MGPKDKNEFMFSLKSTVTLKFSFYFDLSKNSNG